MNEQIDHISYCQNDDSLNISNNNIDDMDNTAETVCVESSPKGSRISIPYDSSEVFEQLKDYLLKILEDKILVYIGSCRMASPSSKNTHTHELSEEQKTIVLTHLDRINAVNSFQDLLPYYDLFYDFKEHESKTDKLCTDQNKIEYYIESLKQLQDVVPFGDLAECYQNDTRGEDERSKLSIVRQGECDNSDDNHMDHYYFENHTQGVFNCGDNTTQYMHSLYTGDVYNISKPTNCESEQQSMKLSQIILSSNIYVQKEKLVKVIMELRELDLGGMDKENVCNYHIQKIKDINSYNSKELCNYCAIFNALNKGKENLKKVDLDDVWYDLVLLKEHEQCKQILSYKQNEKDYGLRHKNTFKEKFQSNGVENNDLHDANCCSSDTHKKYKSKSSKKQPKKKKIENEHDIESLAEKAREYSKVTGVFYGRTCKCWVAQVPVSKGKIKQVYFSVKKHKFNDAREMAINCRNDALKRFPRFSSRRKEKSDLDEVQDFDESTSFIKKSNKQKRSKKRYSKPKNQLNKYILTPPDSASELHIDYSQEEGDKYDSQSIENSTSDLHTTDTLLTKSENHNEICSDEYQEQPYFKEFINYDDI